MKSVELGVWCVPGVRKKRLLFLWVISQTRCLVGSLFVSSMFSPPSTSTSTLIPRPTQSLETVYGISSEAIVSLPMPTHHRSLRLCIEFVGKELVAYMLKHHEIQTAWIYTDISSATKNGLHAVYAQILQQFGLYNKLLKKLNRRIRIAGENDNDSGIRQEYKFKLTLKNQLTQVAYPLPLATDVRILQPNDVLQLHLMKYVFVSKKEPIPAPPTEMKIQKRKERGTTQKKRKHVQIDETPSFRVPAGTIADQELSTCDERKTKKTKKVIKTIKTKTQGDEKSATPPVGAIPKDLPSSSSGKNISAPRGEPDPDPELATPLKEKKKRRRKHRRSKKNTSKKTPEEVSTKSTTGIIPAVDTTTANLTTGATLNTTTTTNNNNDGRPSRLLVVKQMAVKKNDHTTGGTKSELRSTCKNGAPQVLLRRNTEELKSITQGVSLLPSHVSVTRSSFLKGDDDVAAAEVPPLKATVLSKGHVRFSSGDSDGESESHTKTYAKIRDTSLLTLSIGDGTKNDKSGKSIRGKMRVGHRLSLPNVNPNVMDQSNEDDEKDDDEDNEEEEEEEEEELPFLDQWKRPYSIIASIHQGVDELSSTSCSDQSLEKRILAAYPDLHPTSVATFPVGAVIAYKLLELSEESWQPTLSDYKIGRVVRSVDANAPSTSACITLRPCRGFLLRSGGISWTEERCVDVEVDSSAMVEVRALSQGTKPETETSLPTTCHA